MPPMLPAKRAAGTPLAPSVEKAYYRKCIQLKRRLNEVEAANEEARLRRVRLDRAIMKMRLERAFLLEQLNKRVAPNVEGSEASGGEEGVGTPPADRPHREKHRRALPASDFTVRPSRSDSATTFNPNPPGLGSAGFSGVDGPNLHAEGHRDDQKYWEPDAST